MDDFETYLTDQFPLRNLCVSIKTAVLRGTGRRYINDVYIGKEGYLIAKESVADYNRVDRLTESINKFADNVKGVSVDFCLFQILHSYMKTNFLMVPNPMKKKL